MNFVKEMLNELSFAGCKELIKNRTILDRIFWTFWVLVAIISTVILMLSIWTLHRMNHTTTLPTKEVVSKCSVPAFTLCFEFLFRTQEGEKLYTRMWGELANKQRRFYYISFLEKIANFSYWNLTNFERYLLDPTLPIANYTQLQTQLRKTPNVGSYFTVSKWISANFTFKDTLHVVISERGFCKCLNCLYGERPQIDSRMKETNDGRLLVDCHLVEMWKFYFLHTSISWIYVHSPYDLPTPEILALRSRNSRIMFISFRSVQVIKSNHLQKLDFKQRPCHFLYENNLRVSRWYTKEMCMVQCRRDLAVKLCGCSPHIYHTEDKVRTCDISDFLCLSAHKRNLTNLQAETCGCIRECEFVKFIYGSEMYNIDKRKKGLFFSYASSTSDDIIYKRDVRYSDLHMLALWGGSMSLFIGGSLLSLVEIMFFLICWLVRTVIKMSRSKVSKKNCHRTAWNTNIGLQNLVLIIMVKEWINSSTINGIKNMRRGVSNKTRIFWLVMIVTLMTLSWKLTFKLVLDRPALMLEETISQTALSFNSPAVFVQSVCKPMSKSVEREHHGKYWMELSADEYFGIVYPSHSHFLNHPFLTYYNYTLLSYERGIVPNMIRRQSFCELNLQICKMNGGSFECCNVFRSVMTERGAMLSINSLKRVKWETNDDLVRVDRILASRHRCLTIEVVFVSEEDKSLILDYRIFTNNVAEMPCLCPLQYFEDIKMKMKLHMIAELMETDVDRDVVAMDLKHRGCRMSWETNSGSLYPKYGYTTCVVECRAHQMMEICGCIHTYSPDIGNATRCNMSGLKCLEENKARLLSDDLLIKCQCHPNCEVTYLKVIHRKRFLDAQTNFKLDYIASNKKLRLRLIRGTFDTFVSACGLINLFLGSSVLCIVEFIFFFTVRSVVLLCKYNNVNLQNRNVG